MTTSSNTKNTLSVVDSKPADETEVLSSESGDDSLTPADAVAADNENEPDPVIAENKPEAEAIEYDLDSPDLYLNRELTWLDFNHRVLYEAFDESNPLLERLKFVGIVSANLDEFFMKRIGGLKQQVGAGILDYSVDGRLPARQIEECYVKVRAL